MREIWGKLFVNEPRIALHNGRMHVIYVGEKRRQCKGWREIVRINTSYTGTAAGDRKRKQVYVYTSRIRDFCGFAMGRMSYITEY